MYIARLRIRHLKWGWLLMVLAQLINFLDDFTSEPEFFNTTLEGIALAAGLALVMKGFSDAYRGSQQENELQKKLRQELMLTLNAIPVGLIKIDDKFRIEYMNLAMKKILGLKEGKEPVTIGRDIREIPSVKELGVDALFDYKGERKTLSVETPFRSLYGRECYISVAANPLVQERRFLGGIIVVTDITERKKNEQRILYLEGIQRCILEVLRTIVIEKNRKKLLDKVCETLTQSRGYIFAWIGTIEENTRRVIPAAWSGQENSYLETVTITWDETETSQGPTGRAIKTQKPAVVRNTAEDPSYEPWRSKAQKRGFASSAAVPLIYENRILGVLNIYSAHLDAFHEEEIELLEILAKSLAYGLHSLDTEEKRREIARALKCSEKHYRTLVQTLGEGVVLTDPDLNIEYANPVFCSLLDCKEENLVGKNLLDFINVSDWPKVKSQVRGEEGEKASCCELQVKTSSGDLKSVRATCTLMTDGEQEGSKILGIFVDITELKQLEDKLRKSAITDGLTDLYNRTYFNERIKEEVERARRYNHPLSFVMVDIDNFKEINDRYSHIEGDEILKEVARQLLASIRKSDIAFRYGGDEFLLVLPETNEAGAQMVVQRIQQEIEVINGIRKKARKPSISLSIGWATWEPQANRKWQDVLKESDLKMYQDKMSKKCTSRASKKSLYQKGTAPRAGAMPEKTAI
ncbi:MAG: diguanylate cyclase [Peptococcaceae bacterium]|nr:diguanylate cyclase [Peptococcaceae bacterium]